MAATQSPVLCVSSFRCLCGVVWQAFDDADLDKDGKISPEEFVHFAQAHRELWPKLRQAIF